MAASGRTMLVLPPVGVVGVASLAVSAAVTLLSEWAVHAAGASA